MNYLKTNFRPYPSSTLTPCFSPYRKGTIYFGYFTPGHMRPLYVGNQFPSDPRVPVSEWTVRPEPQRCQLLLHRARKSLVSVPPLDLAGPVVRRPVVVPGPDSRWILEGFLRLLSGPVYGETVSGWWDERTGGCVEGRPSDVNGARRRIGSDPDL